MREVEKKKVLAVLQLTKQVLAITMEEAMSVCPEEIRHIVHCKNLETMARVEEVFAIIESEKTPENAQEFLIN